MLCRYWYCLAQKTSFASQTKQYHAAVANPSLIRDINQIRVLNLLKEHGVSSRAGVARALKLTRSTASSLVNELEGQGLVIANGEQMLRQDTGRPAIAVQLNPEGAFFIGAHVGTGKLETVILNLRGQVASKAETGFSTSADPPDVLEQLADLVLTCIHKSGVDQTRIQGVGISVPATVDVGRLVNAPSLGWHDVEVGRAVSTRLDLPVFLENDANASALAQIHFASSTRVANLLYLSLGSGVGAGIVIEGKIYRGAFGAAGEVGYARLCRAGLKDRKENVGTMEAFVGIPGLLTINRIKGGASTTFDELLAEFDRGFEGTIEAVQEWSFWLGRGLVTLYNILNPESIVLGGEVSALLPVVLDDLRQTLRAERIPGSDRVDLLLSPFGAEDSLRGAASLPYDAFFSLAPTARAADR